MHLHAASSKVTRLERFSLEYWHSEGLLHSTLRRSLLTLTWSQQGILIIV
jgi:hypothetical protein